MTAGSDNSDHSADSEKNVKPDAPSVGKPSMTDGSTVQTQTSGKPFMIYPIPKAGASAAEATEHAPEGMTYEEALACEFADSSSDSGYR